MNKPEQKRGIERRLKLFQPGSFTVAGRSEKLHLLDLSTRGARAHAASPPEKGRLIEVECGVPLGRAQVIWTRGQTFGLLFVVPLAEAIVREVVDHLSTP